MLLGARQFFEKRGKSVPTARDYVQDGLVAMWDGIENAGWGVHDANATVWKDLVGSSDWAILTNIGTQNAFEVGSDYVKILSAVTYINVSSPYGGNGHCVPSWTESAIETVELVFDSTDFDITGTSVYRLASFGSGGGSFPTSVHMKGMDIEMGAVNNWPMVSCRHGANSVSLLVGQTSAFVNGLGVTASKNSFSYYTYAAPVLGAYAANPAIGTKIKGIRLYNRVPTDAERIANYAVDKERFNLP